MITTTSAIRAIYDHLVSNGAKQITNISGNIYWLYRPKDSLLEDIVINTVAFSAEPLQEGVFNINVHVPNVKLQSDNTQPDFNRFDEICKALIPLVDNVYINNSNFKVESPGNPVPDGKTWFCNIRIRFWTLRR